MIQLIHRRLLLTRLRLPQLTLKQLAQILVINGAIVPAAVAGVPIPLPILAQLMIQPAVLLRAVNGALIQEARVVGARLLHHPAPSMTKLLAQPKAAVGALHQVAEVAGVLPAPRKNVQPITKLIARRRVKLGAYPQAPLPPAVGALILVPIPPRPKQMPKLLVLIPIINGV